MKRSEIAWLLGLGLILLSVLVLAGIVVSRQMVVPEVVVVPTLMELPAAASDAETSAITPVEPVISLPPDDIANVSIAAPAAVEPARAEDEQSAPTEESVELAEETIPVVAEAPDPAELPAPTFAPLMLPPPLTMPSQPVIPTQPPVIILSEVVSQPVPGQVVISFAPDASEAERAAYIAQIGGTVASEIAALDTVVVSVPAEVALAPLAASPAVAQAEPDYTVTALGSFAVPPSDPLYAQQWALPAIGAPDAWAELPDDLAPVAVAVIDSGICASHADLQGRILPGYDFVQDDADPQDTFGHGCSVAGIIAANMNDGFGMAGVAPNTQVMPLRVLDATGIGSYSNVAAALVWAADHGAQVANLSLGGSMPSTVLENAINYAVNAGVTVVAAAGNSGNASAVLYPAAYEPVISVGAVDSSLAVAGFSSGGQGVDVLAPGVSVLTTKLDGGHGLVNGTSFAAPHVSAAVGVGSQTVFAGLIRVAAGVPSPSATGEARPTVAPTRQDISDELSTAIAEKLFQNGFADPALHEVIIFSPEAVGDFYLVGFHVQTKGDEQFTVFPEIAIARFSSSWEVRIREIDQYDYNDWLRQIPNEDWSDETKMLYQFNEPNPDVAPLAYTGHYLPWQNGVSHTVTKWPQSSANPIRHSGTEAGAWDFYMPVGTELWSTANGYVSMWYRENQVPGTFPAQPDAEGWYCTPTTSNPNYIVINTDDGAAVLYLHLMTNGIPDNLQPGTSTTNGSRVNRADLVGHSGNTGHVCTKLPSGSNRGAHLHFQIGTRSTSTWYTQSSDVTFADPNWNSGQSNPVSGNTRGGGGTSCSTPFPGANEVVFFEGTNYSGSCRLKGIGDYPSPSALDVNNDSVKSVRVGSNAQVVLCRDDNYQGCDSPLTSDDSDLANNGVGYGLSSARVQTRGGGGTTGQWTANYYDTTDRWNDINNTGNHRCTETINSTTLDQDYGINAPSCSSMDGDSWVGDYSGTFNFSSGSYVFHIEHDDGARLWVNGQMRANYSGSGDDWAGCSSGIQLSGNTQLRVMLREDGGGARIRVSWTTNLSGCNPPVQNVEFCTSDNAGSGCYRADSNGVYDPIVLQGTNLNDQIRSVRVPSGRSVMLFREGGLRSTADCYNENRTPVGQSNPWNLYAAASSAIVFSSGGCPSSQQQTVLMFAGQNFGEHRWGAGRTSGALNLDQLELGNETYDNGKPLFNDQAESIQIPSGWSVRVYAGSNLNTEGYASPCLTGDVPDLNANGWNLRNQISSVEIFTNNTTCMPPVPLTPNNLRQTGATETSITIAWDDVAGESGYRIYRWDGQGWVLWQSLGGNTTSHTVTGLTCGSEYPLNISAFNSAGESQRSSYISAGTSACAPEVKLIRSFMTDDLGPAAASDMLSMAEEGGVLPSAYRTSFVTGDSARFYFEVTNTFTTAQPVTYRWDVFDSINRHVPSLSTEFEVMVEPGAWWRWITRTLPDDMRTGTYTYVATITWNGTEQSTSMAFMVDGLETVDVVNAWTSHPDASGTAALGSGPSWSADVQPPEVAPLETYNAGDAIVFFLWALNSTGGYATANYGWYVFGPDGAEYGSMEWFGDLSTQPDLTLWNLPRTIPNNAPTGTYEFVAVINYAGRTTAATSQFYVNGVSNPNLIHNGDFSNGTASWGMTGTTQASDIVWRLNGGVFEWYRAAPPPIRGNAIVLQDTGTALPDDTPMELTFQLGNSATTRKRVLVMLRTTDYSDLQVCSFWMEPNTPLQNYSMQTFTTKLWTSTWVEFYSNPADGQGYTRLDNVTLRVAPGLPLDRTRCIEPNPPGAGSGADSANLLDNPSFSSGLSPWLTFGNITSQLSGGVFEYVWDTSGPTRASVLQSSGDTVAARTLVEAQFALGNSSSERKRAVVILFRQDWGDLQVCSYWLEPNAPLQAYVMRTYVPTTWANANIAFYANPRSNAQWLQVDDVVLRTRAGVSTAGTECYLPGAAGLTLATVMEAPSATPSPTVTPSPTLLPSLTPLPTMTASATMTPYPLILPVIAAMDDGATDWQASGGFVLSPEAAWGDVGLGWQVAAHETGNAMLVWDRWLDLRGERNVRLEFQTRLNTLGSRGWVEATLDGVTWMRLAEVLPSAEWTTVPVDLSAYAGWTLQVRFVWEGIAAPMVEPPLPVDTWMVDQVSVYRYEPTATPTATPTAESSMTPTVVPTEPFATPTADITLEPTAMPIPTELAPTSPPSLTPEPTATEIPPMPTDGPTAEATSDI